MELCILQVEAVIPGVEDIVMSRLYVRIDGIIYNTRNMA
jgi:hypothetical protein